jgi:hypothetical protein
LNLALASHLRNSSAPQMIFARDSQVALLANFGRTLSTVLEALAKWPEKQRDQFKINRDNIFMVEHTLCKDIFRCYMSDNGQPREIL